MVKVEAETAQEGPAVVVSSKKVRLQENRQEQMVRVQKETEDKLMIVLRILKKLLLATGPDASKGDGFSVSCHRGNM